METIELVHYKQGRKSRRGLVTMVQSLAVAIVPDKAKKCVYFGIPGAGDDWLEVHTEKQDKEDISETTKRGIIAMGGFSRELLLSWDKEMLDAYKANPKKTAHPDYVHALLASHKAFTGKDWK